MKKADDVTDITKKLKEDLLDNDMVFQLLDETFCMIEIFSLDGTSVYISKRFCDFMNIESAAQVIGKYNVLEDPVVNDILGLKKEVRKMFSGKRISVQNVRYPSEDRIEKIRLVDIGSFPLLNKKGELAYIVMTFTEKNTFDEKDVISRVKDYLEDNWEQKYDKKKVAKVVGFDPDYFSKVFRKEFGTTPYQYCSKLKINKLEEKLCEPKMRIETAFNQCGMKYNTRTIAVFKKNTGMVPRDYRKERNRKS